MISPLRGAHAGESKAQRFLEDELEGQTGTLRGKSLGMNDFEKLVRLPRRALKSYIHEIWETSRRLENKLWNILIGSLSRPMSAS